MSSLNVSFFQPGWAKIDIVGSRKGARRVGGVYLQISRDFAIYIASRPIEFLRLACSAPLPVRHVDALDNRLLSELRKFGARFEP